MKTKSESSTQKAHAPKKPQIFRFSIIPIIIKSGFWSLIILLLRFVALPQILFSIITYQDQIPLIGYSYSICRLLFLMLMLLTLFSCIRTTCKKIRLRKGTLMYRYGLFFKKTKVFPLPSEVEYHFKESLIQKLVGVSTLTIILPKGDKKKDKNLVFRNLKNQDLFIKALTQSLNPSK